MLGRAASVKILILNSRFKDIIRMDSVCDNSTK